MASTPEDSPCSPPTRPSSPFLASPRPPLCKASPRRRLTRLRGLSRHRRRIRRRRPHPLLTPRTFTTSATSSSTRFVGNDDIPWSCLLWSIIRSLGKRRRTTALRTPQDSAPPPYLAPNTLGKRRFTTGHVLHHLRIIIPFHGSTLHGNCYFRAGTLLRHRRTTAGRQ